MAHILSGVLQGSVVPTRPRIQNLLQVAAYGVAASLKISRLGSASVPAPSSQRGRRKVAATRDRHRAYSTDFVALDHAVWQATDRKRRGFFRLGHGLRVFQGSSNCSTTLSRKAAKGRSMDPGSAPHLLSMAWVGKHPETSTGEYRRIRIAGSVHFFKRRRLSRSQHPEALRQCCAPKNTNAIHGRC
jgi:hypothetical protein